MTIPFQPFNRYGEIRIYDNGILPHWRQDGCTYFVTFRQVDSLPQTVRNELTLERETWLRQNGIDPDRDDWKQQFSKLSEEEQREYEREIGIRLNKALDKGYGSCQLKQRDLAELVADALQFHHKKRVWTGDFVIMPNHVHALLTPISGFELEGILHSIKSFTANRINKAINAEGTFWQEESYDHIVRDPAQLERFQKYIRNNPEKANLKHGEYLRHEASYDLLW